MFAYGFVGLIVYLAVYFVLQDVIRMKYHYFKPKTTEPAWHTFFLAVSIFLVIDAVISHHQSSSQPVAIVLGYLAVFIGLAIGVRCQLVLGKNWVNGVGLIDKHKLVTNGPYKHSRHPAYFGLLLSAIGLGLASYNWTFFFAMVFFWLAYAARIPYEEKLLGNEFKNQHEEYVKKTGMLWPKP